MKRIFLGLLTSLLSSVAIHAQIGYQVSLLNSATGEPRTNETVNVNIAITDAKNNVVHSETQSATTNDFGVLSLVVGNANTFKDVAIGRLPLSISVTVGGTLIGKSQILNVPVAEVANTLKSDFTLEDLCGKAWVLQNLHGYGSWRNTTVTFSLDGTWKIKEIATDKGEADYVHGTYEIEGNTIYAFPDHDPDVYEVFEEYEMVIFRFKDSKLYITRDY